MSFLSKLLRPNIKQPHVISPDEMSRRMDMINSVRGQMEEVSAMAHRRDQMRFRGAMATVPPCEGCGHVNERGVFACVFCKRPT